MWRTVIHGEPAPKGSMQPFLQWVGGKPVARVHEDQSASFKSWRKLVKAAGEGIRKVAGDQLRGVPVRLEAVITLERPASVSLLQRLWPWKKPDADKLARAILDGLTDSQVYVDDGAVVDLHVIKCYPDTPGVPDRLDHPGAVVRVGVIEDQPVKLDYPDQNGGVLSVGRRNGFIEMKYRPNGALGVIRALAVQEALQLARALEHEARIAERADDQEVLL